MKTRIHFLEGDESVVVAEGFNEVQDAKAAVDEFLKERAAAYDGRRVRLMRIQDTGTEQNGNFYFRITTY